MKRRSLLVSSVLAGVLCAGALAPIAPTSAATGGARAHEPAGSVVRHVLLISVDGMHALDLQRYIRLHPASTLDALGDKGVTYTQASTSKPSDSFPGLLSIVTGGSPRSTGVWYDDSYDRSLSAPGSKCVTRGTEVVYDESIDKNPDALDGGGGIDPAKLPLDPSKGCTPVYPHQFLRVNTIFEVIKAAAGHTAWSDKHPAYDLVNGPSGHGVDDLYNPEIAANGSAATASVPGAEAYDSLKVKAVLNEIMGLDHTGRYHAGVPTILGMNFQSVSVAQKLPTGGYVDGQGTPSASLAGALDFVDASLGAMVDELREQHLLDSTLIVVTAKHGQAPIDPRKHQIVDKKIVPGLVTGVQGGVLAQATEDDIALLWLTDQGKTDAVVSALEANETTANIQKVLAGDALQLQFNDPAKDPRTPDVIVIPNPGVIYAGKSATKIAEHGGFSEDDTNVALLVSNPWLHEQTIKSPVQTTQIAPSILRSLGLDPSRLQAVTMEHTRALPGIGAVLK